MIIEVRRGAEGPKHDLYEYVEIKVTHNDEIFTLHEGLAKWFSREKVQKTRNGLPARRVSKGESKAIIVAQGNRARAAFEAAVGYAVPQLKRWHDRHLVNPPKRKRPVE